MGKGGAAFLLLVLLVALGVAGAYNYSRNTAAEQEETPRPYSGYSDAELAALIEAYEHEVEDLESRYEVAKSRDFETSSGGLIDERIGEFERAQQWGDSTRSIGADVAEQEAVLRELRKEQMLRGASADSLELHLRRLLTI
jgi:hypothetical protein